MKAVHFEISILCLSVLSHPVISGFCPGMSQLYGIHMSTHNSEFKLRLRSMYGPLDTEHDKLIRDTSFPSGKVLSCQKWKLISHNLPIFFTLLTIEISVVFSNASCCFFLIFIFRKKVFRILSLEVSFSYLLYPYLYSLLCCYLLFIFLSACLLYESSELNHAFSSMFATLSSPFFFSPLCSPQESSSLKPHKYSSCNWSSMATPLALRITDNFHQIFLSMFCSHAFCLVSLPCLICLCHCILSYFCFSTTLHYLHESTELVFQVHHYAIVSSPNCGFRQWIVRIILSYFELLTSLVSSSFLTEQCRGLWLIAMNN